MFYLASSAAGRPKIFRPSGNRISLTLTLRQACLDSTPDAVMVSPGLRVLRVHPSPASAFGLLNWRAHCMVLPVAGSWTFRYSKA